MFIVVASAQSGAQYQSRTEALEAAKQSCRAFSEDFLVAEVSDKAAPGQPPVEVVSFRSP
jgi:hypothetical protein